MSKLSINQIKDETSYWLFCPGCDTAHRINDSWTFDGNMESPTFSPSILVQGGIIKICHSFVRNGEWQFLDDCTHELAGKTVPMVELPDWLEEEVSNDENN